jgi:hypothetical protein
LEPKRTHRTKMRRWLAAGWALALMYACAAPRVALAQEPTPASNPALNSSSNPGGDTAKPQTASHPPAGTHPKSNAAVAAHNGKSQHASAHKSSKRKTTARGQQKIDPERAQAIQEALIREHYLSGEAAGSWNQSSEDAMRRYQADHGWQSKTVPDSRALISLGLGPSHEHLLNPESAMTTEPAAPRAASLTPVSHSADPGAHMNISPAPATDPPSASTPNHDSPPQ